MDRTTTDIVTELKELPQTLTTVAWLYDGVHIFQELKDFLEQCATDSIVLERRLDHVRIFDESQEYHFWRDRKGGFCSRHRKDDENDGKTATYVEESIRLSGAHGYKKATVRHYMDADFKGFIDSRYTNISKT